MGVSVPFVRRRGGPPPAACRAGCWGKRGAPGRAAISCHRLRLTYSTVWTVLRVRRGHAHERNCSIMHEFESLVFDVITNLQSAMYRRKTSASSGLFFE